MQVTCICDLADVRAGQQMRHTHEMNLTSHVEKAAASAWSAQHKKWIRCVWLRSQHLFDRRPTARCGTHPGTSSPSPSGA